MKLQNIKRAFTLIELLVVITIIGILATGATAVYTSQIQKARDTTRISDMTALKSGLEQAFQDMSIYPGKAATQAATSNCTATAGSNDSSVFCVVELGFLNALPKDPKDGQSGNGSALVYTYNVGNLNGVLNQTYEISTGVEADGFKASKATTDVDGGNDENRVEFGIPGAGLYTCTNGTSACTANSTASTVTANSCSVLNGTTGNVIIRGNCP